MRKGIGWLVFFFGVMAAVLGLCLWGSSGTRTLSAGGALSADVTEKSYVLTGWKELSGAEFSIALPQELDEPLALVFCDMNSFSLYCGGEELYSYDSGKTYERTQRVELPEAAGELRLRIVESSAQVRDRVLLGTAANTERAMHFAYGADMATVGVYVLIVFYSLSLYFKKRSESYLLLIGALALVALASALTNSSLSVPGAKNVSEPVRYFRVVFCAALSVRLMEVRLPKRWRWLVGWQGILGGTALLWALYRLGGYWLGNQLAYLLAAPTALACADGCRRNVPCAPSFSALCAAREALRVYHRLIVDVSGILSPAALYYYYLPQFSGLLFVLGSMIVVNDRFARKFNEVDRLAERLETLNQGLDAQVAARTSELRKANEQLVLEQERKHGMMVNIFHDLRTPIFTAQGSAEMIEPADAESSVRLDTLKNRLDTLEHMAEELFFLAKLEEGGVRFEKFRIRLDAFCLPLVQNGEALAKKKNIAFTSEIQPGLTLVGDSYRLMQAVENLIDNAVKFTPEGGHVAFSVRKEGESICFSVADDGPGIAPEDREKLFERYYQGKLVREKNSTGLGLSIVWGIVRAHDGTVDVESAPGKGSVFTIRLPAEQPEQAE